MAPACGGRIQGPAEKNVPLLTTTLVLFECGNTASRRPYRQLVPALLVQLRDAGTLVDPSDDELGETWQAYDRGEAVIVDQISLEVMRRL